MHGCRVALHQLRLKIGLNLMEDEFMSLRLFKFQVQRFYFTFVTNSRDAKESRV